MGMMVLTSILYAALVKGMTGRKYATSWLDLEKGRKLDFHLLENMLLAINECFDRGVCFTGEEGNLRIQFFQANLIVMKHSKNLPYYR